MRADDENEVLSNASFLHSSADVSKEYFFELSKEFGSLEGEEESAIMLYAPQRKGAAMKNKLSRHLVNTVRSNPEIESFYRFVAENDLRQEALAILEDTLKTKAAKGKSGVKKVMDEDIFKELESKAKMRARASEAKEHEEEIAEAMAKDEGSEDEGEPGKTKKKKSVAVALKNIVQKVAKKESKSRPKEAKKVHAAASKKSSKGPVKKVAVSAKSKSKAKGKKK